MSHLSAKSSIIARLIGKKGIFCYNLDEIKR